MNTKLTLTIDDNLINEAKVYAKSVNRSLSDLISSYLKTIVKENSEDADQSQDLKELIGCISFPSESGDYKTMKEDHLWEKYGNK